MGTLALARVSKAQARRLLLRAQALSGPVHRDLATLVEKLGFVQLDSINYVARAHELILHSRLPQYGHEQWHELLRSGQVFEHWTHDAAIIPMKFLPHWRGRFERDAQRIEGNRWWKERMGDDPRPLLDKIKAQFRERGPLMSRDFLPAVKVEAQSGGWWNWRPEKAALEYLWRSGQLMIVDRKNFHKVYQLTEIQLPELKGQSVPSREETVDWACRQALLRLGVATPAQLAAYWRLVTLGEAREWSQRSHEGVVEVIDPGGKNALARADWEEAAGPSKELRLLAPFDPILRDRSRTELLFDFDFRFEAFVPAAKRIYGYYTLPILDGDQLIGRMTPKFERRQSLLDIQSLEWESGVKLSAARVSRFDTALEGLAAFIGASNIRRPARP